MNTSNKITISDIIKRLEKSAFIYTILNKLSTHFYKSHSILESYDKLFFCFINFFYCFAFIKIIYTNYTYLV